MGNTCQHFRDKCMESFSNYERAPIHKCVTWLIRLIKCSMTRWYCHGFVGVTLVRGEATTWETHVNILVTWLITPIHKCVTWLIWLIKCSMTRWYCHGFVGVTLVRGEATTWETHVNILVTWLITPIHKCVTWLIRLIGSLSRDLSGLSDLSNVQWQDGTVTGL